jgi:hypothetical protein
MQKENFLHSFDQFFSFSFSVRGNEILDKRKMKVDEK